MLFRKKYLIVILLLALSSYCLPQSVKHPEWTRNKMIYEVNLRQYTPEGTFKAFEKHLPRLKEMGVDILWLMPINPIGEKNRKGTLGSYYSVKDYLDVNPEFGTKEDFKHLVNSVHQAGMYIIIDWVANHTSWDNVLTKTNPEFFTKDSAGNFMAPVADWSDVIDLNYDNKDLWKYMTDALVYWIKEFNIDGYRCDVAGMVPTEFWNQARPQLDKIKPVFMLAEWETPEIHTEAFDMSYGWDLYHLFNDIAKKEKSAEDIITYTKNDQEKYPADAYRMLFITNHDENSWNGTEFERLGKGVEAFAVLTFTLPGMPLIYTGQEKGLDKRLSFFEKDFINWQDIKYQQFYTKLISLKNNNKALLNGESGGKLEYATVKNNKDVIAFTRQKDNAKVLVITNLSDKHVSTTITGENVKGEYRNYLNDKTAKFSSSERVKLAPWEYLVFIGK